MNTKNYRVEYLCPKAVARIVRRSGKTREQVIRENATLSSVKHLPGYSTAAEAQAVADSLNAKGTGRFAGMVYFHVVEREVVLVQPPSPGWAERMERDMQADYEIERETMGEQFANESDAFARRVMGMD